MHERVRRFTLLSVVVALLSGCAAFQDTETTAQRFYAAQGSYNVVLGAAATYALGSTADPMVVRELAAADYKAQEAIAMGQAVVRSGGGDAALEPNIQALRLATQTVRALLIRKGVLDE
jgi:hypothetical protein